MLGIRPQMTHAGERMRNTFPTKYLFLMALEAFPFSPEIGTFVLLLMGCSLRFNQSLTVDLLPHSGDKMLCLPTSGALEKISLTATFQPDRYHVL